MLNRSFIDGNGNVVEPHMEKGEATKLLEVADACLYKSRGIESMLKEMKTFLNREGNYIENVSRYDGSDYVAILMDHKERKDAYRDIVDLYKDWGDDQLRLTDFVKSEPKTSDFMVQLRRLDAIENFLFKIGFKWDKAAPEEIQYLFRFMEKPVE